MFSPFADSFRAGMRPGAIPPAALPNISVWYDASSPTYFQPSNPVNGDLITQWNDKSGASHNASTSGNPDKPTYVTPAQNGYGAVSFNGTSNFLQINNTGTWMVPGGTPLNGFTLYVVFKSTSTSGTRTLTYTDQNGFANYISGGVWVTQTAGGTGTSTVAADTTNYNMLGQIFDGTLTGNDNRLKFRYNTVQKTLSWGATTVNSTINASTNAMAFGANNSAKNASNFFQGLIAEVVMLSRAANVLEIEGIENYLKLKWNI